MTETVGAVDAVEPRRPGRPRSVQADESILEAAVEILAESGLDGLTVEGVAARAGVGKATIYRRYSCKVDLVIAAVECLSAESDLPLDTGSTRDDFRAVVDAFVTTLTSSPMGRALPILIAARSRIAEIDEVCAGISAERRGRPFAVVDRAIARGDLRPDVDPDTVVDQLVSPVFYRFLLSHAPLDGAFADSIVDTVLRAFGTTPRS